MNVQIESIRQELQGASDLRKRIEEMITKFIEVTKQIEILQAVTSAYEQIVKQIDTRSTKTERQNQELESEINHLKSLQRKDNLIISGVPSSQTETVDNLKETVKRIAACCGVSLKSEDIVNIYRLKDSITVEHQDRPKYPLIMVKFDEKRAVKQSIYHNYIKLIGQKLPLRLNNLGLNGTNRIYLNHHLSPALLIVRKQATDLKKLGVIERTVPRHDSIKLLINGKWLKINTIQELKSKTAHLIPMSPGRGG